MKFTLSWLKDHLDTTASVDEITATLTQIGLEVESVEDAAKTLAPFTVAHVISAEKHPNADKLRVCMVETATGTVQVVCGAPNARTGMKGVFAAVGSVIPGTGVELKAGQIRGQASNGMLCSEREMGLSQEHDGIIELPADAIVGTPIAEVLGLNDPVIDIAITPNRGDANGVAGVARDVAAAGLGTLKNGGVKPVAGTFASPIRTGLDLPKGAESACPMFAGRLIRNVKNGASPDWVQRRLRAVGLRPISALVDVTNLLSLDRARPLHVFDADKLTGNLRARLARKGETIVGLDTKLYELDEEMCVIADEAGPRGIAGVMGGLDSGCTAATTNVFIESALFDAARIAATGRKLGINSDARYRFERGVDPEFCLPGLELATQLILTWCGGEPSEPIIAGSVPAWRRTIAFDPASVAKLAGLDVPADESIRILRALGFAVDGSGPYTVIPPSWRSDIGGKADLVEEVVRIYGLDKLPSAPLPRLSAVTRPALTPEQRRARDAKRGLAARGLIECVTNSFIPRAHAELFGGGDEARQVANPISADLDAMRPSVLPSLLAAVARNEARGFGDFGLFEVGPQFTGGGIGEQLNSASGLRQGSGQRHWTGKSPTPDVFAAKADVLALIELLGGPASTVQVTTDAPAWYHPGRSGAIRLGPKNVMAFFGELHPRVLAAIGVKGQVAAFELALDTLPLPKAKPTKTKPPLVVSDYQAVERDFAFVVERRVTAADIIRAAQGADRALIESVGVIDVYEGANIGEGRKSIAISIRLQPRDRTLTDVEIDAVAAKIVASVAKATGATLRA